MTEKHGGRTKRSRTNSDLDPAKAAVKADEVQYLDGGLPRHLVLGGDIVSQYNTRWDFSKDFVKDRQGSRHGRQARRRTSAVFTPFSCRRMERRSSGRP